MAGSEIFPFTAAVGIEGPIDYYKLSEEIHQYLPTATYQQAPAVGRLAVGLLMSEKTGLLGIPNRHGKLYPNFINTEDIADLRTGKQHDLSRSRTLYPLPLIIHYNSDNQTFIQGQLRRAIGPIAESVDGVQINNLSFGYEVKSLELFKEKYPDIPVILQVNSKTMDRYKPKQLAKAASKHSSAIDYLWLDGSGGLGKEIEYKALMPYVEQLKQTCPDIKIGVAGGLNADNLAELLLPFLQKYPDLSWDAQSGIQKSIAGERRFSRDKARKFLLASKALRTTIRTASQS